MTLERTNARFPRVLLDNQAKGFVVPADLRRLEPVFRALAFDEAFAVVLAAESVA